MLAAVSTENSLAPKEERKKNDLVDGLISVLLEGNPPMAPLERGLPIHLMDDLRLDDDCEFQDQVLGEDEAAQMAHLLASIKPLDYIADDLLEQPSMDSLLEGLAESTAALTRQILELSRGGAHEAHKTEAGIYALGSEDFFVGSRRKSVVNAGCETPIFQSSPYKKPPPSSSVVRRIVMTVSESSSQAASSVKPNKKLKKLQATPLVSTIDEVLQPGIKPKDISNIHALLKENPFESQLMESEDPLYILTWHTCNLYSISRAYAAQCGGSQDIFIDGASMLRSLEALASTLDISLLPLVLEALSGLPPTDNAGLPIMRVLLTCREWPNLDLASKAYDIASMLLHSLPDLQSMVLGEALRCSVGNDDVKEDKRKTRRDPEDEPSNAESNIRSGKFSSRSLIMLAYVDAAFVDESEDPILPCLQATQRVIQGLTTSALGVDVSGLRLWVLDLLPLLSHLHLFPVAHSCALQLLSHAFTALTSSTASALPVAAKSTLIDVIIDLVDAAGLIPPAGESKNALLIAYAAMTEKTCSARKDGFAAHSHGGGLACLIGHRGAASLLHLLSQSGSESSIRARVLRGITHICCRHRAALLSAPLLESFLLAKGDSSSAAIREAALDYLHKVVILGFQNTPTLNGKDIQAYLPQLIACIEDESGGVRKRAVRIIQNLGMSAEFSILSNRHPVMDHLMRLCTSLDETVVKAASAVLEGHLRSITPGNALLDFLLGALKMVDSEGNDRVHLRPSAQLSALQKIIAEVLKDSEEARIALIEAGIDKLATHQGEHRVYLLLSLLPLAPVDGPRLQVVVHVLDSKGASQEILACALRFFARFIPVCSLSALHVLSSPLLFDSRLVAIILRAPEAVLADALACLNAWVLHSSGDGRALEGLWTRFSQFLCKLPAREALFDHIEMPAWRASVFRALHCMSHMLRLTSLEGEKSNFSHLFKAIIGIAENELMSFADGYTIDCMVSLLAYDTSLAREPAAGRLLIEYVHRCATTLPDAPCDHRALPAALDLVVKLRTGAAQDVPWIASLWQTSLHELPRSLIPSVQTVMTTRLLRPLFLHGSDCGLHPSDLRSPLLNVIAGSKGLNPDTDVMAQDMFRRLAERHPAFYLAPGIFSRVWAECRCGASDDHPDASSGMVRFYVSCLRGPKHASTRLDFLRAGIDACFGMPEKALSIVTCLLSVFESQLLSAEEARRFRGILERTLAPLLLQVSDDIDSQDTEMDVESLCGQTLLLALLAYITPNSGMHKQRHATGIISLMIQIWGMPRHRDLMAEVSRLERLLQ